MIGANKEAIIAEKRCTARLGQTAVVGYSGGQWWAPGWRVASSNASTSPSTNLPCSLCATVFYRPAALCFHVHADGCFIPPPPLPWCHPPAEPIITADFPDFESFWAKVQEAWDAQWQAVFGADWQGAGGQGECGCWRCGHSVAYRTACLLAPDLLPG